MRIDVEFLRRALHCPTLELELQADWNSRSHSTRCDIRAALTERVRHDLSDLNQLPVHPLFSLSVSHCKMIGGYALCEFPQSVGLDVEVEGRVTVEAAARIATPVEVAAAPSPAALWGAKEAVFKALLGPEQPEVVSSILIHSWRELNSDEASTAQNWNFSASHLLTGQQIPGKGIWLTGSPVVCALFSMRFSARFSAQL